MIVFVAVVALAAEFPVPPERAFRFSYEAEVRDLPVGKPVRVWIPLPSDDRLQSITSLAIEPKGRITRAGGNRMVYWEGTPESPALKFRVEFDCVRRRHVNRPGASDGRSDKPAPDLPHDLRGSRLAPVDGEPARRAALLIAPGDAPDAGLRKIYDHVVKSVRYDKTGTGWGTGSIDWVCKEGRGNCTDFHALLLSMARSQKIPCRFEMGFPLPADKTEGEIGGYHCWAAAWLDGCGWVPLDASEARKRIDNPAAVDFYFGGHDPHRVGFSTGRDVNLEPLQAGPALNFFVYPHVEVDGKAHPHVTTRFTFRDRK